MQFSGSPGLATAYHEAGHAVARYLEHGTTGAIVAAPFEGKEAAAESESLPPELVDGEKLLLKEYSPAERDRLIQEVKTTLAGCVAEGMLLGRSPFDVLEEAASSSDRAAVWGIAGRLWPTPDVRDAEVARLADDLRNELGANWPRLARVAEAYDERKSLTPEEVRQLVEADP